MSLNALAGVTAALPTSLLVRIARQQTETVDFSTSNVRGSAVPLFLAGARVDANYPIGPTVGTAFNLTCLSYGGSLDMGLNIDVAAVEHPVLLRNLMEESFDELVQRGSSPRKGEERDEEEADEEGQLTDAGTGSGECVSSVRTSSKRSATSAVETSSRATISRSPRSMMARASSIWSLS